MYIIKIMPNGSVSCVFVSDLHGNVDKYRRLFAAIEKMRPDAVFLGGDLLPSGLGAMLATQSSNQDFLRRFVEPELESLRRKLGKSYPRSFVILGNDDGGTDEQTVKEIAETGLWEYIHNGCAELSGWQIYGYAFIPPTPFVLKDWERYDVSRFVDAGCIPPEEGAHSIPVTDEDVIYGTIEKDLLALTDSNNLERAVFLFHTPPYQTKLDRAALDDKKFDGVALDVHIGSIAVRRFIERRQPYLTLHGHVHESARLTGSWRDMIGTTELFSAAHDGPELALVSFDLGNLATAKRELIA
jgi:Icc-related predicted phosphoesterase